LPPFPIRSQTLNAAETMKAEIGLIPGIIREEVHADLWCTLARVAEIGYQGLQGGNVLAGVIEGNRKRLDDIGLQAIAIGAKREQLSEDIGKLIKELGLV